VLAGPFDMVLLDEPSSGLDAVETERFGHILRRVVSERGIGILIVEHDVSLVRQVCDRVSVMDLGRTIFEGTIPEMLKSNIVQTAYLGSEGAQPEPSASEAPSTEP
jgi:ABC-type branched-subunit amino acid transport system ATPase component